MATQKAFVRRTARRGLQQRLDAYRRLPADSVHPPRGGWVKALREALGMSAADLAARMGVAESTVLRMEGSEQRGTVRLDTLQRAAQALDCDLVYALVPRTTLDRAVRQQAEKVAGQQLRAVAHTMLLEGQQTDARAQQQALGEAVDDLVDTRGLWRAR